MTSVISILSMKSANKYHLMNNNSRCVLLQKKLSELKSSACSLNGKVLYMRCACALLAQQQKLFTLPLLSHSIAARIMRARINDEKAGLICQWQVAKFEPMSRYVESRASNNIAAIILQNRQIRQRNVYTLNNALLVQLMHGQLLYVYHPRIIGSRVCESKSSSAVIAGMLMKRADGSTSHWTNTVSVGEV